MEWIKIISFLSVGSLGAVLVFVFSVMVFEKIAIARRKRKKSAK